MAAASTPKATRGRPPESVEIAFEKYLLSLHRLSTALGDSNVLAKNSVGVSEWAVLSVLAHDNQLNLKQVVRQAGVSRQRIRKVLQELQAKKLVTVSQFLEGDKRQRVVSETPKAARVRRAILAELRQVANDLAGSGAGDLMTQRFAAASRLADRVVRMLKPRHKTAEEFWAAEPR
jgi:DNA-binding MarR family transcriptional regulator